MRPGLANAFLIGFVESLADFGNPLVLGGNFDVLSTEIFFAIVGGTHDQGRAAALSIVLLVLTLSRSTRSGGGSAASSYTTISGKGDAGLQSPAAAAALGDLRRTACRGRLSPPCSISLILVGGFVESLGRNNT